MVNPAEAFRALRVGDFNWDRFELEGQITRVALGTLREKRHHVMTVTAFLPVVL